MTDDIWRRDEIESPCVKLCVIHPETRLCMGCARSIDEITAWPRLSGEDRRRIMAVLESRPKPGTARRGGRAARGAPPET